MRCVTNSAATRTKVIMASAIWRVSDRCCRVVTAWTRHCDDGRDLKLRTLQMTYRLTTEPPTARTIIGIRIASAWNPLEGRCRPAAAARALRPITTLTPLIAITAVQALCSRTNRKLEIAMVHERRSGTKRTSSEGRIEVFACSSLIWNFRAAN